MTLTPDLAWFSAIGILAAYEIWAVVTNHMTLSRSIWMTDKSKFGSLLPFLAGLLCGHFFWSGN